jgi:HD-like signal output (HDOD) protein
MHAQPQMVAQGYDEKVRSMIAQAKSLPPMPMAVLQLMEFIRNDDATVDEFVSAILRDQALSAKLLRIANSAYFGLCGKVSTLSRAVMAIGFREVRNLCLCAVLLDHFPTDQIDEEARKKLWEHAFATARFANVIAHQRPWMNKEEAYILGLLHDFGRLVILYYFNEHYCRIKELANLVKIPFFMAEWQYGITHTQVGKWLSKKWHFPKIYECVLEYHHFPWKSPTFQKETKLIYLADVLANYLEYPELAVSDATMQCCKELYIPEEEWQGYCDRVMGVWEQVNSLWRILK